MYHFCREATNENKQFKKFLIHFIGTVLNQTFSSLQGESIEITLKTAWLLNITLSLFNCILIKKEIEY